MKKRTMPPLLLVTYEDIAINSDGFDSEDAKKMTPTTLNIVGFLQREEEWFIVLSQEWRDPDKDPMVNEWRQLVAIPKVGILSQQTLRIRGTQKGKGEKGKNETPRNIKGGVVGTSVRPPLEITDSFNSLPSLMPLIEPVILHGHIQ